MNIPNKKYLSFEDVDDRAYKLSMKLHGMYGAKELKVYGHPRGGISTCYVLRKFMPNIKMTTCPRTCDIIIEDIYDTGETTEFLKRYNRKIFYLFDKRIDETPDWIVFPWETDFKEKLLGEDGQTYCNI